MEDFIVIYNYGLMLERHSDLKKAIECYERVLLIKPDFFDAYYRLGRISMRLGDMAAAMTLFRKAIEADPSHIDVPKVQKILSSEAVTEPRQGKHSEDYDKLSVPVKIEFGGGEWNQRKRGFLQVDIDERYKPDIVDDMMRCEKINDNSVDEIFCSHTLEHIYDKDVVPTLRLWLRKLNSGGKITLRVPDVEWAWKAYFANMIDEAFLMERMIGADQTATPFMLHKTFFWEKRLKRLMEAAGFVNVERMLSNPEEIDHGWHKPLNGGDLEMTGAKR